MIFWFLISTAWACPIDEGQLSRAVAALRDEGWAQARRNELPSLRVRDQTPEAIELPEYGQRMTRNIDWSRVPDDNFIFLTDRSGTTYYAPRVPLDLAARRGREHYLVSHRSLLARMRRELGREPDIITAGEFFTRGGRLHGLNNASGTFHPGSLALAEAQRTLEAFEIPRHEPLAMRDLSKGEDAGTHIRAVGEAQDSRQVALNPQLRMLAQRLRRISDRLYRLGRDPDGGVDVTDFYARYGRPPASLYTLETASYLAPLTFDSPDFLVMKAIRQRITPEKLDLIFSRLETLVQAEYARLGRPLPRGLDRLPSLPPRRTTPEFPEEIARYGRRLDPAVPHSRIPNDSYIFITDRSGHTYYAPRVPVELAANPAAPHYLASHRSLIAQMRQELGREPDLVAAGEFFVRNHQVTAINNASGTLMPGNDALTESVLHLQESGLPISPRVVTRNLAQGDQSGVHFAAQAEAQARRRVSHDPALRTLRDRLVAAYDSLMQTSPSPHHPGIATTDLYQRYRPTHRIRSTSTTFLSRATFDSFEALTAAEHDRVGLQAYTAMIEQIELIARLERENAATTPSNP